MEDERIIGLFFERNEMAISAVSAKYGRYCYAIAYNILSDREDAEECVDDTYVGAWNAIPPAKPVSLSAFLGKITRNLSLDKLRARTAEKRGGGETPAALDELEECVAGGGSVSDHLEAAELTEAINAFLAKQKAEDRKIFVCRYFYFDAVKDIADRFGFTQSKVKMVLKRTRDKLMQYLKEEGLAE